MKHIVTIFLLSLFSFSVHAEECINNTEPCYTAARAMTDPTAQQSAMLQCDNARATCLDNQRRADAAAAGTPATVSNSGSGDGCQITEITDSTSVDLNKQCCEAQQKEGYRCCQEDPMSCAAGKTLGDASSMIGPGLQMAAGIAGATGGKKGMQMACLLSQVANALGAGMGTSYAVGCKARVSTCTSTCEKAMQAVDKAQSNATLAADVKTAALTSKHAMERLSTRCESYNESAAQGGAVASMQAQAAVANQACAAAAKEDTAKTDGPVNCSDPKYGNDARCAQKPNPGQGTLGESKHAGNYGDGNNGSGLEGSSDQNFNGFEPGQINPAASSGVGAGGGQFLGGGPGGGAGSGDGRGADGSPYNPNVLNGTQNVSGGGSALSTGGEAGGGGWYDPKNTKDGKVDLSKFLPRRGAARAPSGMGMKMVDGITAAMGSSIWEKVSSAMTKVCNTPSRLKSCR
jgi:hypothetical protein